MPEEIPHKKNLRLASLLKPDAPLPSERSFGCLFTVVFIIAGAYGIFRDWSQQIYISFFIASGILLLITLLWPKILRPFNYGWFLLGQLLGKIVSPIVLGVLFFGLITPIAIITRIRGRDELRLKGHSGSSYWVERSSNPIDPDSFKNQF